MTKLTILVALIGIITWNACTPSNYCTPISTADVPVKVFCSIDSPIIGSPLRNIPIVLTVENCVDASTIPIKTDTILTGSNGRLDTIIKNLNEKFCDNLVCMPKISVAALNTSKFVIWGTTSTQAFDSKTPTSFGVLYKPKAVLKLQIKHDSTDVSSLFISASQTQLSTLKLVDTRTTATNKSPFNLPLFFNIAKGEDAQLNIQFDKKVVRLDTIKGSQLDTIFKTIVL
jgi:hypothetical protein